MQNIVGIIIVIAEKKQISHYMTTHLTSTYTVTKEFVR